MGDEPPSRATPDEGWRPVTEHFAANAARVPDRTAIEAGGASITYAGLAVRVEHLAARLAVRLTNGNRLVGVCLDRDIDMPAWLLAILRVGGAYLPLDPSQPAARLLHVVEDAGPALIVASRANLTALPPTSIPIMTAEVDETIALPAPAFAIQPDMLAYVIYTSGSTGRPKGVEIEHGALTALMEVMADHPGFADGERLLALTRISFDLSVPDIFLPLFVGGTMSIVGLEVAGDPERLAAAFACFRPDLVQGTPSVWRGLLEWGWQGLPGLRLLAGGEAMTRDLADRLLPRCGELWNVYGPTEATVWATTGRVKKGTGPVSIGWPMNGTTVHVTDPHVRPLPLGEVGEIVIGGAGVARGYRNRPELTRDRFVHLASGERAYRTGDLGRFGEDGALFCLGRLDDQVKVRGFRVELGDVEAALAAHPAVAWCAARLWTDLSGEGTLVGYIVTRAGEHPPVSEIKAAMAARVPSYMVPDRILTIATMPLTPNGKVDRAALPSPFAEAAPGVGAVDGSIADQLAEIWRDLLGVATVGPSDDFFDLGGYSLMTVRLTRRIHSTFGVKLALVDLMRCSTLAAMAGRIADGGGDFGETTMLLNEGGERSPIYWLDAGPLMRTMARAMPAGQPVFTLNLSDEDEASLGAGALRVEDVAARLRRRLVAIEPKGPYRIGGWCRWGIVAFELARQLRHDGDEGGLLVLLDADRPGARPMLRAWLSSILRPPSQPAEPLSFSERVALAAAAYRPQRHDGDVLVVRPRSAAGDGDWRRLVGGRLTIVRTDGDHESMVRHPHVKEVAEAIAGAFPNMSCLPTPSTMMAAAFE